MKSTARSMSLWMLTWPIFLEMFLQFLLGAADTLMVSRISDDAVAVIGISSQLFQAVNILFMAIASGAGILIAQKLGGGKEGEARTVAVMGAKICLAIGVLLSVLLHFGAAPIAVWLQLSPALQPLGQSYISIVGSGMMFMAAMAALGTVIRNTGNTRGPMYIAIGMNVIHVLINYVVIYGPLGLPQLGLEGVAWSTTFSRLLGACAMLFVFRSAFTPSITWRDLTLFDRPLLRETLRLSWPLGITMSSWCFTQLVLFSFVATLGDAALSTRTYMNTMESFCFMVGFSIAVAGQIRIAHQYGSGDTRGAYRSAYQVVFVGLLSVELNALLLYFFGRGSMGLFTDNAQIAAMGAALLAWNLLLQPAKMLNMGIGNALNATGDSRFTAVTGITSMWLVAVGLSYVLAIQLGMGLLGIYLGMIADELLRGVLVLVRWTTRGRKGLMSPPRVLGETKLSAAGR
jgi:putative MATE family efflux protein